MRKKSNKWKLTSRGEENFQSNIAQQISTRKDGSNLPKGPLRIQVPRVGQYLHDDEMPGNTTKNTFGK